MTAESRQFVEKPTDKCNLVEDITSLKRGELVVVCRENDDQKIKKDIMQVVGVLNGDVLSVTLRQPFVQRDNRYVCKIWHSVVLTDKDFSDTSADGSEKPQAGAYWLETVGKRDVLKWKFMAWGVYEPRKR
jgi:hypothetical protein